MIGELLPTILIGTLAVAVMLWSADFTVKRAIALAKHFDVSETLIGLTIISIGTSLPEIGSAVSASIGINQGLLTNQAQGAIIVGGVTGSDIIQQTLILGLIVLLSSSLYFPKAFRRTHLPILAATVILTLALAADGLLSRLDGTILLLACASYVTYQLRNPPPHQHHDISHAKFNLPTTILLLTGGLATLLAASMVVLNSTEQLIQATGLQASLLGVLILGIAAALPELLTALRGVTNKASGISIGVLIGSNIINPLLALGLGATISTYLVPQEVLILDLPTKLLATIALSATLYYTAGKLNKKAAVGLIGLYAAYLLVRVLAA